MSSTLLELWDFSDPAGSEARFVNAIEEADARAAFILSTQVARTYGLRKDFQRAKDCLASLVVIGLPDNLEAQAYYHLEWGDKHHVALEMQLKLEQEWKAEGGHDVYVWEDLEHLYRALSMPELEKEYAKLRGSG